MTETTVGQAGSELAERGKWLAMSDEPDQPRSRQAAIEEHETIAAESIVEGVEELFEPDNDQIPPASPDEPPPDAGGD